MRRIGSRRDGHLGDRWQALPLLEVSPIAELFQEIERVKLRFIAAYDKLRELGHVSEEEYKGVCDALERLDELSEEEFAARLGKFKALVTKAGGQPG